MAGLLLLERTCCCLCGYCLNKYTFTCISWYQTSSLTHGPDAHGQRWVSEGKQYMCAMFTTWFLYNENPQLYFDKTGITKKSFSRIMKYWKIFLWKFIFSHRTGTVMSYRPLIYVLTIWYITWTTVSFRCSVYWNIMSIRLTKWSI